MFSIEMLPADEGDALWIEYGEDGGAVHRVLIDCGRRTSYRIIAERLAADPALRFELFVLTHVDADHIAGAVPLLRDERFGPDRVLDVWFNGYRHLCGEREGGAGPAILGAKQGEYFSALLRERGFPWNAAFDGHPVRLPDQGPLPRHELPGGMVLTLLGPTQDKLDAMRDRWEDELGRLGDGVLEAGDHEAALELLGSDRQQRADVPILGHGPPAPIDMDALLAVDFDADGSEPNGSSISFLAEYGGKAVIFAGDAHAPQLAAAVARLCAERGLERLPIDALKMGHHGSARNNDRELLGRLDCSRFLLSSNGSRHHHPDPAAVARVLDTRPAGVELVFNYRSEESELWDDAPLAAEWGYRPVYPSDGGEGVLVTL